MSEPAEVPGPGPAVSNDDVLAGAGPIERASLSMSLEHLARRLASLEAVIAAKPPGPTRVLPSVVEVAKVVFGGWPAFGLLFLILFYGPLRDAISAIPEKVKAADEIGVLGVSLKSTLRREAERAGAITLSETLPALSASAVELLLRATPNYNGLVAYSSEDQKIARVWFPGDALLSTLAELETKQLIRLTSGPPSGPSEPGTDHVRGLVADFKRRYPGREGSPGDTSQILWELNTPTKLEVPQIGWRLTDLGTKAVDVILKAVSSQLDPPPSAGK